MSTASASPTSWVRAVLTAIGLSALVAVIVLAFAWPTITAEAHDLPVGIVGSDEQIEALESALDQHADGVFVLHEFDNRADAVEAIESRGVYGAIILGTEPEVLTAGAAGAAASGMLGGIATQLQGMVAAQAQAAGIAPPTVTVTDVVPLLDTDANGAGIATSTSLPLVLGGMVGGIAIALLVVGTWRRLVAVLVYAAAAGLVLAGITQGWFGVVAGDYLVNASAFALCVAAIGGTIVGIVSLLGRPGIAIAPVLFVLIASPIASASTPREFLPGAWGQIGQWFPPGAGATLIRDLSYFPNADTSFPWLVLMGWALLGIILTAIGHGVDTARSRASGESGSELAARDRAAGS